MSTSDSVSANIGRLNSFIKLLFRLTISNCIPFRYDIQRYGEISKTPYFYPNLQYNEDFKERLRQLNEFLLDGKLPDGKPCGYKNKCIRINRRILETRSKESILKDAIGFAVNIRASQIFWDGNHRTAILSIHERLAEFRCSLTDPKNFLSLDIYTIISHRNCKDCNQAGDENEINETDMQYVKDILYRFLKRKLVVHDEGYVVDLTLAANRVKELSKWNSLMNDMIQRINNSPNPTKSYRDIKKVEPKRLHQFLKLTQYVLRKTGVKKIL